MEKKKEVRADTPVTVAGVTLIPVTEIVLNCWQGKSSISFYGVKRPVGMVMVSPSLKKAFRVTGEEVPLDQFRQEFPGIKEILDEHR